MAADDSQEMAALRAEMEAMRNAVGHGQVPSALPPPGLQGWDQPLGPSPRNTMNDLHSFLASPDGTAPAAAPLQVGPPLPPPAADPLPAQADLGATEVLQALNSFAQTAHLNPGWGQQFWAWSAAQLASGKLGSNVERLLRAKGFVGSTSVAPPDVASLRQGLEILSGRTSFAGAVVPGVNMAAASDWVGASGNVYSNGLPIDMRRAAPEIYRSIRGEGTASTRQWLKDNFTGYRGPGATQWTDLWSTATTIDMALAGCRSESEMLLLLNTDDRLEIGLRHLGAHFYEQRTRDKTGAAHMRAVATPGVARDIMPTWSVAEATTHSKAEHQRNERVETEVRRRAKDGKGDGKGKKGKKQDA